MTESKTVQLSINPYKGFYKSAVAISFDYETSAIMNIPDYFKLIKRQLKRSYYTLKRTDKDLSGIYGRGYGNRWGAERIAAIFQKYGVHGTWFSTGHCLLKENKRGDAYRINQCLPYVTREAGFPESQLWRCNTPTFTQAPKGDYKTHPYCYLGDQAQKLREMGEDIQCHTFSHPYIPFEPVENIRIDLSDWQSAAVKNGFKPAKMLAFPYLVDVYKYYGEYNGSGNSVDTTNIKTGLKAHPGSNLHREEMNGFETIGLPETVLRLLKEMGIEVVTRTTSCFGKLHKGFTPYRDSDIFHMPDIYFNPALPDFETLKNKLREVIENGYTVNFWTHPNDVFSIDEVENFEAMVKLLTAESKLKNVWLATISDIWKHFKKTKGCHVEEVRVHSMKRDSMDPVSLPGTGETSPVFEVRIRNGNDSRVEWLGVRIEPKPLRLVNPDSNILPDDDGVIIRRLESFESYRFRFVSSI